MNLSLYPFIDIKDHGIYLPVSTWSFTQHVSHVVIRSAGGFVVGRGDWLNGNTGFGDTHGFNPGYGSTVVFDRPVNGIVDTAAAQEQVYHLQINRPGGSLRPADILVVVGNLNIQNGS